MPGSAAGTEARSMPKPAAAAGPHTWFPGLRIGSRWAKFDR